MDQNRTNEFFDAMIKEYTTCIDCQHFRMVSDGVDTTLECNAGNTYHLIRYGKPCEKFKECEERDKYL